jgi:hypothetical protein
MMCPGVRANPYHIDRPAPSASSDPSTCWADVAAPHRNPSGKRSSGCVVTMSRSTFIK